MRAKEFLLEYRRQDEMKRIEAKPAYKKMKERDPSMDLNEILAGLEKVDPTTNNKYVPRLAEWWFSMDFPDLENFAALTPELEKYEKLKNLDKGKPVDQRIIKPKYADINQFLTPFDFIQVVGNLEVPDPPKIKPIYKDDDLSVIQLLNRSAGQRYGVGCVADTEPYRNMFGSYSQRGELYVIKSKSEPGQKYQYWASNQYDDAYEFRNKDNESVDPPALPFYKKLKKIFEPLSPNRLWWDLSDPEKQMNAVKKDVYSIKYIDDPTEEVALYVVERDGELIEHIPNPSEEVQLAAANDSGYSIYYLYKKGIRLSEKVKLVAAHSSSEAIRLMYEYGDTVSDDVIETSLNNQPSSIKYIPKEKLTPERIEKSISVDPGVIRFVANPSEKMQRMAVQRNGRLIKFLYTNKILPSEQVRTDAVQNDGDAISYIPTQDWTLELQIAAVKTTPRALYTIVSKLEGKAPDIRVQMAAVQTEGRALRFLINSSFKIPDEVIVAAIRQDATSFGLLRYMDTSYLVQKAAIKADPDNIIYIYKPSLKIMEYAVRQDPRVIQYMRDAPDSIRELAHQLKAAQKDK